MAGAPQVSLAKRIAAAYNYSYEANMGDYSMASIDRAANRIAELKVEAGALGVNPDDLVEYVEKFGHWRAKED